MRDDSRFRNSLFTVRALICMMQEDPVLADGGAAEESIDDESWA